MPPVGGGTFKVKENSHEENQDAFYILQQF